MFDFLIAKLLQFLLDVIVANRDILFGKWIIIGVFLVLWSLATGQYFCFNDTVHDNDSSVYFQFIHVQGLVYHTFPEYWLDSLYVNFLKHSVDDFCVYI